MLTLMRFSPADRNAPAISLSREPLVVSAMSSMPGMPAS